MAAIRAVKVGIGVVYTSPPGVRFRHPISWVQQIALYTSEFRHTIISVGCV